MLFSSKFCLAHEGGTCLPGPPSCSLAKSPALSGLQGFRPESWGPAGAASPFSFSLRYSHRGCPGDAGPPGSPPPPEVFLGEERGQAPSLSDSGETSG